MTTADNAVVLYESSEGSKLEVHLEKDTVWLTLNQISDLFSRDKSVISRHLHNVFREGELVRTAVVAKYATTATDGKTYQTEYFNLDVIISVGYRVKSQQGARFRIWATNLLKDHIVKGYTINEQRFREQAGNSRHGIYNFQSCRIV